ncbi:MAG TPA: hypothetical protein QF353_03085 [Gammaproteobacteria bacterium]|nr:hypothetical protein [Gammaproteobacteria bacterium]
MKQRQLLLSMLMVLAITLIGYIIKYFVDTLIATSIGAGAFGNFKLAIRVLFLANSIVLFGQDYNLVYFLSRYKNEKSPNKAHGYLLWLRDIFIAGSLITLILASAIQVISYLELTQWPTINLDHPGYLILFLVPLYALFKLGKLFHLYRKDYAKSMIPTEFSMPFIYYIITVSTLALGISLTENIVLYLFGTSLFLVVILQWSMAISPLKRIFKTKPKDESSYWYSFSRTTWLVSILLISTKTIAMASLEIFSPNEVIVGYFAAISTITYSYYVITEPIEFFLRPLISPHNPKKPVERTLQLMLNRCQIVRIFCIILIVGCCLAFGNNLLLWFGPQFVIAQKELILAAVLFGIYVFFRQCLDIIAYSGHQKWLSKAIFLRVLSIGILSYILIPKYHLLGAVLADGIPAATLGFFAYIKLHSSTNLRLYKIV